MISPQFLKGFCLICLLTFSKVNLRAEDYSIILGRPTASSITLSILHKYTVNAMIVCGEQSNQYPDTLKALTLQAQVPLEVDLLGLKPNTKYYYKYLYKTPPSSKFTVSPEYHFSTQKAYNQAFTFTLEADEHLYDKKGVRSLYQVCLNNQAEDQPDFMMSLGDIFGDDHNPFSITSHQLDSLHKDYRPYLGSICHSIPFYVCLGNHEGENDYYKTFTPPNNLTYWGTQWRKYYYPNPYPNSFYTGNTELEPYGIDYPENYYAWHWGNALFVVLDVYRNQNDTTDKPQGWNWSLGKPQYDWLKATLESDTSQFKFVFAHHIRGQGRGGISNAQLYEWGGYNKIGGNSTFSQYRPGWAKPIHQLFVDNGVNVFFQGHDHVFAHEVLNGVTYQSLPMPSDSTYTIGQLANADAYLSDTLSGSGHISVNVSSDCIRVKYVRAYLPKDTFGVHKNREIAFAYQVGSCQNTAIQTIVKSPQIKVYPIPTQSILNVYCSSPIQGLTLNNALGQKVMQGQQNTLDVSQLPNGVYCLEVLSESQVQSKKIVIQH